ncbi:MAG: FecR family protein [Candidatus Cloacimonetes bacterium]|nr:FecR family protein [Candidatus Cloacimonadota bacterium]
MKKIIILASIFMLFAMSILAEESVGIALKVKGDVFLSHQKEVTKAADGSELENEDKLESKEESYAFVKFIDGSSVVKLFPNSILTINTSKENGKMNKNTKINIGELWAKVTKNSGDFIVDTPTTVVSVKGTRFVLAVDENGVTDLFTLDGVVNIRNKEDDNETDVGAGKKARTSGSGEIVISNIEENEMDDYDIPISETMNINLKNEDGEQRSIKIDFE